MDHTNYEYRIPTIKKPVKLNHLRGFVVKYLSPTDYRGSRVKITDTRHQESVILSYDYQIGHTTQQAIAHLLNRGISCNAFTSDDNKNLTTILSLDFATPLKGE